MVGSLSTGRTPHHPQHRGGGDRTQGDRVERSAVRPHQDRHGSSHPQPEQNKDRRVGEHRVFEGGPAAPVQAQQRPAGQRRVVRQRRPGEELHLRAAATRSLRRRRQHD
ncbi:hypothetical protein ACFQ3Z_05620 [Streptomyces nogalater]